MKHRVIIGTAFALRVPLKDSIGRDRVDNRRNNVTFAAIADCFVQIP